MVVFDEHKNFASSLVAVAPSPASSGTTLTVTTGEGTLFATPPFNAVVKPPDVDPTRANAEILRVTNIVADLFTVVRAQESSLARTILVGDRIYIAVTAKSLTDIEGALGLADPPTLYQNVAGSVTKANIKNSSGSVYAIRFTNKNASARYLQLHNKATAPAAGDTAQLSLVCPGGSATQPAVLELGTDWFSQREFFATGLGWAVSTTATTFTDSATASEHEVQVRYV